MSAIGDPPGTPAGRRAAVMFSVQAADYVTLARALGPGWTVEDASRCLDPDLVVVRPCSRQTLAGLRRRFGQVPVVELDPDDPLLDWRPEGWAAASGAADKEVSATHR